MSDVHGDREDRLERLFERAMSLSPSGRAELLSRTRAADPDVHGALTELLANAEKAYAFVDQRAGPAVARAAGTLMAIVNGENDELRDPLIGERIAHFQISIKLGGGGMGVVYKALDLTLGRTVALKFLSPHAAVDEAAKQRLLDEARAASVLDHPAICAIHEIGETPAGQLFIAMAFCDGETLERKIASGPLPVPMTLGLLERILEGLQHAHEARIVHRDVKPANVMVGDRGQVKIVDFGLATTAGATRTRDAGTIGTLSYMSPEQTRGETVDGRTDIWSLGVVLYEMLTGHRPFRGENDAALIRAIRNAAPTPIQQLRAEVGSGVSALVARCLEKDPTRRYTSAEEMLADVRAAAAVVTPEQPRTWRHRAPLFAALAVASFAVLAFVATRTNGRPLLRSAGELVARPEVNPVAFAHYLQGLREPDDARGMHYLEQAIAEDSTFALAYAHVARAYIMILHDRAKAERAIEKAIQLDPSLSESYDSRGLLRMWIDHDWPAAEAALRRSIELNPYDGRAHHELGQLLMRVRRCDEAIIEERRALRDVPSAAHYQSGLAEVLLYCRRYDEAVKEFERTLALVRDSANVYRNMGDAYFYQRRYDEALSMYEKSRSPPGWAYIPFGDQTHARKKIERLKTDWETGSAPWAGFGLARIFTSLGERAEALAWLERCAELPGGQIVYLKVHPHFDALRGEPRFAALLKKVHLTD